MSKKAAFSEKPKLPWNSFPGLKTAAELSDYFVGRVSGHKYFYHYTGLASIDNIIGNREMWISCVSRFNDVEDQRQFGKDKQRYYSVCFSTGSNENLALWYLYSGQNGRGGRIGFTKSKLNYALVNGEFCLREFDPISRTLCGEEIVLIDGKNMTFTMQDVLYISEGRNHADLKYNTMTNHGNVAATEIKSFKRANKGFCKDIIWYHEKETRLLIKLSSELAETLLPDKTYVVVLKLPKRAVDSISVMLAPEIEKISEIAKFKHITAHRKNASLVTLSRFSGKIHMALCDRCDIKRDFCANCKSVNKEV